ncbi:MAG: hypothetical protein KDJ80_09815 [Nitratireductor sp.]|nr:hypothetical protein [Nitratireductor sp.]
MDAGKRAARLPGRLAADRSGNVTVQSALLFGAIVMSLSMLAVPYLKQAADTYAQNRALGIDRTTTGSVSGGRIRTYTIRKSVLDPQ